MLIKRGKRELVDCFKNRVHRCFPAKFQRPHHVHLRPPALLMGCVMRNIEAIHAGVSYHLGQLVRSTSSSSKRAVALKVWRLYRKLISASVMKERLGIRIDKSRFLSGFLFGNTLSCSGASSLGNLGFGFSLGVVY